MLAAVGPFAIEAGLVAATGDRTHVRIHNVNTAKLIDATVATPGGRVTYEGDAQIDGVPGRAAPIELSFPNASGARTGRLLPTERPIDVIDGIDVTCIDAAMPVMLIRAADLGWTGREAPSAFAEPSFRARLEALRIEAGRRMGFPDPASMVIPKPILIAPATNATLNTRYFMPHDCHSALAVTGAVAIATACVTSGTLAAEMAGRLDLPASVTLAHPTGHLVVRLEPGPVAQVQRTARRIFEGMVFARRSQVPREAVLAA
jgi:2-methylaconitate cis-trans-isomerase PrpF